MDSENRIIEQLQRLIPVLTEELLISMSNKGTVNRAKKDLDKLRGEIAFQVLEDGRLVAIMGDIQVILREVPQECSCSCPASGLCRHVLTVFFYGMEYLQEHQEAVSMAPEPVMLTAGDMKELNCLTQEDVIRLAGKKEYASIAASLRRKNEAEISFGQMVKVAIPSQGATVYFPKENSLAGAVCSCKEKVFCRHKLYGLMSYLLTQRQMEFLLDQDVFVLSTEMEAWLGQVKLLMAGYMDKGVTSLSLEVIKELERCYIRAYSMKLYELAGELKLLSSYFFEYFNKNVEYSNSNTLHLVCRIVNRADALLTASVTRQGELAGRMRQESFQLSTVSLLGLGAAGRLTKRKDLLVSQYFYCTDLEEFFVLSTLRPVTGNTISGQGENGVIEKGLSYLYTAGLFWAEEYALKQLSGVRVTVRDAVLSKGKISGTKKSSCKLEGELQEADLKRIAVTDFKVLETALQNYSYHYFSTYSETLHLYLLHLDRMGEASYDSIRQRLLIPVYDKAGQELILEIRYSEVTKRAVKLLEKDHYRPSFHYVLVKASQRRGQLWGELLSGFDGRCFWDICFTL